MTTTLRARGLSVHFGATVAVQPLDLDLHPGRLVAVTGPSGAGKSSLLGALAGLYPAAGGTVELDGTPLRDRDDAVARHVVLIPQGNALVRLLSAEENVALPLLDRRHRHVREAARDALTSVGLAESSGQLVEELSGGQQQRLAIARGLAERGAIVLADEPTSELDAANRALVMALLRAESNRGAAVLVATHDPDAAALCDAELCLDEGAATWIRHEDGHHAPEPRREEI
ncbi:MAG TPA: ATP-binding cassette domain-containing protein [Jatrophihabitans sp.]|uniref:ABC transporter ATP-binding protein n=1 Tax=Jatrophihabitans sp. TaxID=1932789 RepID=UPI002E0BF238|nr:ATP-binding cassette domain-containing protein [Jatrophihabitans sp.]